MAEELNRRLDGTLQQTAINAFGSVKQRVATHLLDLASAQQRPVGRLVARVSQQELADAVGSVREVVARALRDFRLAGLVATAPDSVLVLDPTRIHEESWATAAEWLWLPELATEVTDRRRSAVAGWVCQARSFGR